jgi:cytochrome c oxidase subunit 2
VIGSDNLILWAIAAFAAICAVILVLLAVVTLRRKPAERPRIAARLRTRREPAWTAAAVLIVVFVGVPLARLIYLRNATRVADVTINVTGNFWYWTYQYSGEGNVRFDVPMLANAPANNGNPARAADHLVVPVGETIRIVSVGTRLFYSWTIPSLGASVYAIPGLKNESWFRADKEGVYYGRPTELCAVLHTFVPVEIEVVSRARFDAWVAQASAKLAAASTPRIVAAAR